MRKGMWALFKFKFFQEALSLLIPSTAKVKLSINIFLRTLPSQGFLLGNLSFAYAFCAVEPTKIVDWVIETIVDISTPGKEVGGNDWTVRSLREMQAEKAFQEMDVRVSIRKWDEKFPWMHHELIIRFLTGFLTSSIVLAVYRDIRGRCASPFSRKY